MSLSPIRSLMLITASLACQFLVSHAHRDRLMEEDTKVPNDGVAGDDQPSLTHSLIQEEPKGQNDDGAGDDQTSHPLSLIQEGEFAEWTDEQASRTTKTQIGGTEQRTIRSKTQTLNSNSRSNSLDRTAQPRGFAKKVTGDISEGNTNKVLTFEGKRITDMNGNAITGKTLNSNSRSESLERTAQGNTIKDQFGRRFSASSDRSKNTGNFQTYKETTKNGGTERVMQGKRSYREGNTNVKVTHKTIQFTTSESFKKKMKIAETKESAILKHRVENLFDEISQAKSQRTGTFSQGSQSQNFVDKHDFTNPYVNRKGGTSSKTVKTSEISSNSKTQLGAKSNIKQTSGSSSTFRTINNPGSRQHVQETTTETSRSGDGLVSHKVTTQMVTRTVLRQTMEERNNPVETDGRECVNKPAFTDMCTVETGYRCRRPDVQSEKYICFCMIRDDFDKLNEGKFLDEVKKWLPPVADNEENLVVDEDLIVLTAGLEGMKKEHCQTITTTRMKQALTAVIKTQAQKKVDKLEAEALTAGSDCGEGVEGQTGELVIGKDDN